jgi:DNA mismatch repair protein MutS
MSDTTPMMSQYRSIKQTYQDAVLFFRLGDFYEMFDKDAREVSALLNLTLTKRNGLPMCGIPYHSSHLYIPRLLRHGKKIAICEQTSLPEKGKGIVDRKVVEIISPGTVTEEDYLEANRNNYIVSLARSGERIVLASIDISTGDFYVRGFEPEPGDEKVREEFIRLDPSEVIIQESLLEERAGLARVMNTGRKRMVDRYPDWSFDLSAAEATVRRIFGVSSLKGYGFDQRDPLLISCGVLLEYVEENSQSVLSHLRPPKILHSEAYVGLDEATQKNLELVYNLSDRTTSYTLLQVLDYTKTAMGGRNLRSWMLYPLRTVELLHARQRRVDFLHREQMLLSKLRSSLSGIRDLERLTSRVAMDKAHAKDLLAVGTTLETIREIADLLGEGDARVEELGELDPDVGDLDTALEAAEELQDFLQRAIHEEPSIYLSEGRLIREGYDAELDELRKLKHNSKQVLDDYLEEEKQASDIPNLKIRYNKIIGYFLEVTKANVPKVPDHFIRRQSLVGSERYTTERLGSLEEELNNATEKIIETEKRLFFEIREQVKQYTAALLSCARAVAVLDTLQCFAYAATVNGWSRPQVDEAARIAITEGRHPVVEAYEAPGNFVPNSVRLDDADTYFDLITGPNMSGKSTFLRQNALIVLLAQIGSFVPAQEAEIGVVDRIFCRVGASDNLARGESTFLVEMNETSYILNTATPHSLVIMDEVGRGTSTGDGISIAWAVVEYLLEAGIKTLFATHYHELTRIEKPGLHKLFLEVREEQGEIVFLKRVREGNAASSYGLHVAKLAGLPREVLRRAEDILHALGDREDSLAEIPPTKSRDGGRTQALGGSEGPVSESLQSSLFSEEEMLLSELAAVNIDETTPLEALNILSRLKQRAEAERKNSP